MNEWMNDFERKKPQKENEMKKWFRNEWMAEWICCWATNEKDNEKKLFECESTKFSIFHISMEWRKRKN